MKKVIFLLFLLFNITISSSQEEKSLEDQFSDMGVSVSPSSIYLNITPGKKETREITVKNLTKKTYKFNIGFSDFIMNEEGKRIQPDRQNCDYCLSKYITINPQLFEIKPGEEIKIKLNIAIPDSEHAYKAMWTIITIDQYVDRPKIDIEPKTDRLAFGIIPTFGFGVYVYQNPPNVKANKIEIIKFDFKQEKDLSFFELEVKNAGDGIAYCNSYISITNMTTGEQQRVAYKKFTLLPNFYRKIKLQVPENLMPGKYTAVAVVDFGDAHEMIAAETTIIVK